MCGIAGCHTGSETTPEQGLLLATAGEPLHHRLDGVGIYLDAMHDQHEPHLLIERVLEIDV